MTFVATLSATHPLELYRLHTQFYVDYLWCFCQTPVLGLGLGVDFSFAWDNHNHNNPHLNFMKGTVLGDKEQGVGIRDKG